MKKFAIEMLPPIPEPEERLIHSNSSRKNGLENKVRLCIDASEEIAEKIKDHAYWERLHQKDMLLKIVESFISKNPVESRPQAEKFKGRPGRKSKK